MLLLKPFTTGAWRNWWCCTSNAQRVCWAEVTRAWQPICPNAMARLGQLVMPWWWSLQSTRRQAASRNSLVFIPSVFSVPAH